MTWLPRRLAPSTVTASMDRRRASSPTRVAAPPHRRSIGSTARPRRLAGRVHHEHLRPDEHAHLHDAQEEQRDEGQHEHRLDRGLAGRAARSGPVSLRSTQDMRRARQASPRRGQAHVFRSCLAALGGPLGPRLASLDSYFGRVDHRVEQLGELAGLRGPGDEDQRDRGRTEEHERVLGGGLAAVIAADAARTAGWQRRDSA